MIANRDIDLLGLAKTLWGGRRTILTFTIIFTCIGLFIALFSPREFTSKTIMVPQATSSKVGGNLGGLAAMAGISLGGASGGEVIPPSLYPKIINSIPFKMELLQTKLSIEGIDHAVTYQEYYENHHSLGVLGGIKKYTIGLPGLLLSAIKGTNTEVKSTPVVNDGIIRIPLATEGLFNQLRTQVYLNYNDKDGYIDLSVSMPQALPAAQMTLKAQALLQTAIIKFKIEKAEDQLYFIEERFSEVEKVFKQKQGALAYFKDRNLNLITSRSQSRLFKLQVEYDLAFGVYSELTKQVEAQKIQVKEDTPVFTILEPVSVPNIPSKPDKLMIILLWLIIGTGFGVISFFIKVVFEELKKK
ncbi:MAG: capsule biosynthesis protein [Flavobacteriaceae bacterium]|nr:capsule biosynthesis protein [Flavobacteriaceae bacterium]